MVRADGTTLDATPEEAARLELLGYKPEGAESRASRLNEVGREGFYTGTFEQVKAGVKAFARGVSLGTSDYLFDDDATRAQQQYNPGLSMGLEIAGNIAPLLVSGGTSAGAQLAARTPAALAARAGTALAEATSLGRYGKAALAVGVEGGIVGGASEVNRAYLADDDLTVEAVFHGVGFGSIFGAGAGVLGARFLSAGESAAAKLAGKVDDAEFRMADDGFTLLPRGEGPPTGARSLSGDVYVEGQYGGAADRAQLPGRSPFNRPVPTEHGTFYGTGEVTTPERLQLTTTPERLMLTERTGVSEGVFDDLIESPRPAVVTPGVIDFAERAVAYATAAEAEALDNLNRARTFGAGKMGDATQSLSPYELLSHEQDRAISRVRLQSSTAELDHYEAARSLALAKEVAAKALAKSDDYTRQFSRGVRATEPTYQAFSYEVKNIAGRFADSATAAESVMAATHAKLMAVTPDAMPGLTSAKLAFIKKRLAGAFSGIEKAGVKGSPALKEKALAAYTEAMEVSAESLGISIKAATSTLDLVATVGEAGRVLRGFPATAEAFAALSPAKAEQLFAALTAVRSSGLHAEVLAAVDSAADSFVQTTGLRTAGADGIRSTWGVLRDAAAAEKLTPLPAISASVRKRFENEATKLAAAAASAERRVAHTLEVATKLRGEFTKVTGQAKKVRANGAAAWEKEAKAEVARAARELDKADEVLQQARAKVASEEARAVAAEKKAADAVAEAEKKAADAATKASKKVEDAAGAKAQTRAEAQAQAKAKEAETQARQGARQAEAKVRQEAESARKAADQAKVKAESAQKAQRVAEERSTKAAEADARRAESQARQDANYAYTQERRADQAQRRADADAYTQERRADQAERRAESDAYRTERRADQAERQAERDTRQAERRADREAAESMRPPGVVGAVGAVAGRAAMGGFSGAMAGRAMLNTAWEALAALRLRTTSRLNTAAAAYFPRAGKAVTLIGPKIEPLSRKLDGTTETAKKSREELAGDRLKELWNAYGAVNDTLYEGVTQLAGEQPALMAKMHALGASAYRELLRGTPRDPGTVSGLKSIWGPSPLQAIRLGRQLEVFHDPIGEYERMLTTGSFDPIGVKMLKAAAPAIYQEGRSLLLARLGEGNLLESMSYPDQIALSTMLELDIHSSMRPEHIASSQALHLARKEPMEMPIKPAGSAGGRPPSGSSDATASQQVTAH
jgi:hypothetical protein